MMGSPSRLRPEFALVALLLFVAYLPAMSGEFLMSDFRTIVGNARLVGLRGLLSIWLPVESAIYSPLDQYQPLTYSLWWLERRIFGLDPIWYQVVSVTLHAVNAVLVWGLLSRIGARGAVLAAAVFALHPVHVESVAWIYEQKNPLSGLFFLATLHAYLSFDRSGRRVWYVAALALFFAALMAKSTTVLLPAVIVVYLWFRRDPVALRTLVPVLPFLVMGAAMSALTIWYEIQITGASGDVYGAGALERGVRAGWLTAFSLRTLLVPIDLAFFYPLWAPDVTRALSYLPGLALVAALGVLVWKRESWGRPALLAAGWYGVLLFPVMGFFDIFYHRFSLWADHFQYLPSIGLIAGLCHAGAVTLERFGRTAAIAVGLAVAAGLGGLTWQRSHVFANEGLLARDAADKYPTAWVAFQKSGEYALKQAVSGRENPAPWVEQALADLERARSLRPDHPQVQDSLGAAYQLDGRLEAARRSMERAVEGAPDQPGFRINLARVYEQLDEPALATAQYRALAERNPETASYRLLLGRALLAAGRLNEGAQHLDAAIELATPTARRDPNLGEVARQARQLRKQASARTAALGRPTAAPIAPGEHWNVLLLTIDTLRPDYLSANGYPLPTSPAMDALVEGGVYFERALAPVPRTTPALASLFTGAYPHVTGVRSLPQRLPGEMVTLTEALQQEGYQTAAVVTNMMLDPSRGLAVGFDVYDPAFDVRDARHTTDAALQHLGRLDPRKPTFAWVHYIDPHVPYHPKGTLASDFSPGYAGRFAKNFGRQPGFGEPPDMFAGFPEGLEKSEVTHRNPLSPEENEHIRKLYAADVRTTDGHVERLVDAFRARFPRTVIVFTADHGESLGEHDFYFDHGDYVYNASSRVPLAFVLPEEHPWHGAPRRIDTWVSLVDIAPTLFDILGRTAPPEMSVLFEGRSLAPELRGEPSVSVPVFIESGTSFAPELVRRRQRNTVAGRFRAVALGDWKLIWTPYLPDDEAWELYDMAADPHETRNLYRSDHPEFAALKAHLERWVEAESNSAPAPALTERDREALKRLGYLE